jgi:hypothetical protein
MRNKNAAKTGKLMAYGLSAMLSLATVGIFANAAKAQSTIMNIPSTDTVDPKKVYFEFDSFTQAPKVDGADRIEIMVPRFVAGVAKGVEAGANFGITHQGGTNVAYFQPALKWKLFSDEKSNTAATIGAVGYTPMNHRTGNDSYGLFYMNFSKKVGKMGPRLTAGPYGVVGGDSAFHGLTKAGAILGLEQTVYKRLSFVADWFSAKNAFGYFTPAISVALPKNSLLNAGYSIGNDSYANSNTTKNRYVYVYYGITL